MKSMMGSYEQVIIDGLREIREAARAENRRASGELNYCHIDWVSITLKRVTEVKCLDAIRDCFTEKLAREATGVNATTELVASNKQPLVQNLAVEVGL